MNTYSISYITNSGITILNDINDGRSKTDVIESIKGDTGVAIILSCVKIS